MSPHSPFHGPVATENGIRAGADAAMGYPRFGMIDLLKLLGGLLVGVFRSHAAREAEMAFLRHQLVVLKRSAPARLRLRTADRLIFVWLYREEEKLARIAAEEEKALRMPRSRAIVSTHPHQFEDDPYRLRRRWLLTIVVDCTDCSDWHQVVTTGSAAHSGTDGSNPPPSSGESRELPYSGLSGNR